MISLACGIVPDASQGGKHRINPPDFEEERRGKDQRPINHMVGGRIEPGVEVMLGEQFKPSSEVP